MQDENKGYYYQLCTLSTRFSTEDGLAHRKTLVFAGFFAKLPAACPSTICCQPSTLVRSIPAGMVA